MKRFLCLLLSAFFCLKIYPQLPAPVEYNVTDETPSLFKGIWQGADRLIMFGDENNRYSVVLRTFNQWYDDRACEPSEYKQIKTRDRNNTTSPDPEDIDVEFIKILENPSGTAGVYELKIKYPKIKGYSYIPVCLINGNLYLDFLIKDSALDTDQQDYVPQELSDKDKLVLSGFYRDASNARGITVSLPLYDKELLSYYIQDGSIYSIRYWLSDMEYTYEKATFSDGEQTFSVDKFLRVGGKLYQCTTGRSSKIRNISKSSNINKVFVADENGMFIALGNPYLSYVPSTGKWEELIERVQKDNSRKFPPRKPPFPPDFPKYRFKDISELDVYNIKTWTRRNIDIHQ